MFKKIFSLLVLTAAMSAYGSESSTADTTSIPPYLSNPALTHNTTMIFDEQRLQEFLDFTQHLKKYAQNASDQKIDEAINEFRKSHMGDRYPGANELIPELVRTNVDAKTMRIRIINMVNFYSTK